MGFTRLIEQYLVDTFGYQHVIEAKDVMLFVSGVFIGGLILAGLSARVFYKVTKLNSLGKVSSLRLYIEGKRHYFANPSGFCEALEILLIVIFLPTLRKRDYTIKDEKRTILFIIILGIAGVTLSMTSLLLIGHPILHPELFK